MKIQPCVSENNVQPLKESHKENNSPSFRAGSGGGIYGLVGNTMQWIQDKGFIASFLIQDGLGMTMPRVGTAYMRDREVTGEFNAQEGREVLLREGLTGPIMMAMAPLMFAISAKFGKSTTIDSQLIKRFGNSFKEMISKAGFKKELLNNKEALRTEYLKKNIDSILKHTLGEGKYNESDVKFILDKLNCYSNPPAKLDHIKGLFKKRNYRKSCLSEIDSHINNLKYKSSSELELLDKVKVGGAGNEVRTYETVEAMESLVKYSDDVITNNKHLADMTAEAAEDFKNISVSKRIITTIATVFATLGAMSVIPKIYAKSDVSPGARTAMIMRESERNNKANANADDNNSDNVSFKGKGGKGAKGIKGWLAKLGKFIGKHQNENFSSELEYKGHNFTNTLFAALSVGGLLTPRGLRAYNRAQIDENGKRDYTELYEILIRDLTSSLSVIFAVPILTRAFVSSYEHKKGFVLLNKDRTRSKTQNILDILNPMSKTHVLTNKELESLYFGIDSSEKMMNFCKYIDKNNGDLQKIFSKSECAEEIFNEKTFKLADLEKLPKAEKNKRIISMFEDLTRKTTNKEALDMSIKKMMQGPEFNVKKNKLLSHVKGLNSIPAAIATFAISPIILGWFIPTITYANTRRIHAKKDREAAANKKVNTAA